MELQRVVSTERDPQAAREEVRQRVAVVAQEQRVVAERGHRDVDLRQVIHVLQHRYLGKRSQDVM